MSTKARRILTEYLELLTWAYDNAVAENNSLDIEQLDQKRNEVRTYLEIGK